MPICDHGVGWHCRAKILVESRLKISELCIESSDVFDVWNCWTLLRTSETLHLVGAKTADIGPPVKTNDLCLKLATQYSIEGAKFFEQILTYDKTWVIHRIPKLKCDFMQWKHIHSTYVWKLKTFIIKEDTVISVLEWTWCDTRRIFAVQEYNEYRVVLFLLAQGLTGNTEKM